MPIHQILIVEDTPNLQRWLAANLRSEFPNAKVSTAATVKEALSELGRQPADVVILDLGIPVDGDDPTPGVETGLGFLRRLKARADSPRVVVLSGDSRLETECLGEGAHGCLAKDMPDLAAELTAIVSLPH